MHLKNNQQEKYGILKMQKVSLKPISAIDSKKSILFR